MLSLLAHLTNNKLQSDIVIGQTVGTIVPVKLIQMNSDGPVIRPIHHNHICKNVEIFQFSDNAAF